MINYVFSEEIYKRNMESPKEKERGRLETGIRPL